MIEHHAALHHAYLYVLDAIAWGSLFGAMGGGVELLLRGPFLGGGGGVPLTVAALRGGREGMEWGDVCIWKLLSKLRDGDNVECLEVAWGYGRNNKRSFSVNFSSHSLKRNVTLRHTNMWTQICRQAVIELVQVGQCFRAQHNNWVPWGWKFRGCKILSWAKAHTQVACAEL